MCNNLQGSVFSSWTYQFIENILHKYYVLFLLRSYCSSQVFYYFLKCVINTNISLFLSLKICLVNIKCVFSSKQLRLNSYNFFPFKKKKKTPIYCLNHLLFSSLYLPKFHGLKLQPTLQYYKIRSSTIYYKNHRIRIICAKKVAKKDSFFFSSLIRLQKSC